MKSFILTFFISSFVLMGLSIGLITAIDPYDKLGNNLFGFETKAVAQSRENKFYMFESSKKEYKAFILGSSAAHRFPTQKVEELTGYKTFNYAVQHSTPIDYLAIVKHILSKSKPELVLLQLDFAGLDETYSVDNRLFNSPLKKYLKQENRTKPFFDNNYFTLDAFRDSFRVIFVNKFGKARHIYLEDGNYIKEKIGEGPIKIKQGNHTNYQFSDSRTLILKEIKELCDNNDIKIIAFSAPLAIGHVNRILNDPNMAKIHHHFNKEMSNVFGSFWDFENSSLSSYNDRKYFHDSTHPTMEMSSLILERIFTGKPVELGLKL